MDGTSATSDHRTKEVAAVWSDDLVGSQMRDPVSGVESGGLAFSGCVLIPGCPFVEVGTG